MMKVKIKEKIGNFKQKMKKYIYKNYDIQAVLNNEIDIL